MTKREIPAALQRALDAPYSLEGLDSCDAAHAERAALDEVLGPDIGGAQALRESRAAKLAQAGGRTLVNSIIPFRGLIREISGAAPADRRMEVLVDAGHARRGFLRGVEAKLHCDVTIVDLARIETADVTGASH
ncbi:hypothetical protein P7B02_04065 [Caulobacter segnis]|uniref:hypothetical protein n=1 Tax=Caulobacter segnis TaxID=88688 RepID=UPI00240F9076|nr:hypothetical protein [Caulobacter segnis]MDG2520708.1 hypothetical protein [Caulobacter segnis]